MAFKKRTIPGLPDIATMISSATTSITNTLQTWCNNRFSLKSHKHTSTDITGISSVIGYPDYSNRKDYGNISSLTAPSDGWIFATYRIRDNYWNIRINDEWVFTTGGSSWDVGRCFLPVKKGDVIESYTGWTEINNTNRLNVRMIFFPNR